MNKYFRKILSLLTRKEKKTLIYVFLGILVMGFLEVIGVGSIMPFISVASDPTIITSNIYLNKVYNLFGFMSEASFLFALGTAVIVFLFISNLARALVSYTVKRYAAMRNHYFSVRLLRKYISQPYVFFLNQNTSGLIKNTLGEVSVVVNKVLLPGLEMITNIIICFFIIGMLVFVDPVLSFLVVLILSVSYTLIYVVFRKILKRLGIERLAANTQRYKYTSEVLNGIKDVKILGRELTFLKLYEKPSKKFCINDAYNDIMGELPKYALETIAFGGILVMMLSLIKDQSDFSKIIPLISLYAFAGYRLMPAMQKIFRAITKLKYSAPVVDLLYDHMTNYENRPLNEKVTDFEKIKFNKEIVLDNIRFYYPGAQDPVIKKQSITIQANTTVGIVGSTGCGKTTLVDIVLGLLEPQEGNIYIDGVKITTENLHNWQANLGYVPQSIFLTDDTIASNIAFGVPPDEINMDAVLRAANVANLATFIEEELELQYDTLVGERGVRLSGGQRQRIGIARAVYHNPSVLILDEATSALDGLTESAIMDAIHNLSHKKTIIMIAHRITTVKECDVIYIMEKGRIIDSGKYDELIQRNKQFRQMAKGS